MLTERATLIEWWDEKWGTRYLTSLVLDLRLSCNGAAEPWGCDFLAQVVHYLDERVRLWQEPSNAIDMHVRAMCQQAVLIGKWEISAREQAETYIEGGSNPNNNNQET